MSDLAERARAERRERADEFRRSDEMWDKREAAEVAQRATRLLGVPIDAALLSKVSGSRERTLWQFEVEGHQFLGGVYWERIPGPAGNAFFLAVRVGKGRVKGWPPPQEHGDDWCPEGFHRIHRLSDFADAIDYLEGIESTIERERSLFPTPEMDPKLEHGLAERPPRRWWQFWR